MNQMQGNWAVDASLERLGTIEATALRPSRAQREAWLMSQGGAEANLACVQSLSLRLCGKLDVPALRLALQDLVDRHVALRSSFSEDGERLCVADTGVLELAVDDFGSESAQRRDAAVASAQVQVVATPFDLCHGPLLRGRLLRLGAEHHLLVLAIHRAAGDRRLLAQLLNELAVLYACQLGRRDTVLHAAAARDSLPDDPADGMVLATTLQRLAAAGPLDLAPDLPRPPKPCLDAGYCERGLSATPVLLERFASGQGVAPGEVALAACALLLARLSGQSALPLAVALGEPGGLARASVWQLLPLQLDTTQGFAALLHSLPQQRAAAGACSLGQLLEQAARRAVPSVAFSHEFGCDGAGLNFPDLVAEVAGNPRRAEWFELSLNLVVGKGGLALQCHYQSALYTAATIEHWLEVYDTLLAAALQQPERPLAELPVLSATALQQLEALQPAPCSLSPDGFIHSRIDAQCLEHPLRSAQLSADGELSYGELATWSNRIANELLAQGIGPGDRVGLCLPRDGDLLPALLAVLKTGAAYVPLDPAFPPERLAFMAADSGLRLILSRDGLAERCGLSALAVLELDRTRAQLLQRSAQTPPALSVDPRTTPAYVIYTSGSTGTPKGVVLPHAAVCNFLEAMREAPGLAAEQRLLAVTTLSFDIAVLELLLPLWVGATTVIATREQASDGRALHKLLRDSGATVMQATPATWRLLLDAGFEAPADFVALCGGEALQADLAARLQCHGATLWNLYGPTETTVWSATWRCQPRARGIAIGRPIRNTRIYVLDALGQQCPLGVPGEIYIGGDGVALGYHERDALNAARFLRDPFAGTAGARMYRTGDRGRWASDGLLEHLGRLDHQIKLRGYRIELGEIEARLAQLDAVAQCLVIVREDRPGDARLCAYLVVREGQGFVARQARAALRRFLPDYMIPQHFIVLATLPRLPNGKIDRAGLPSPLADAVADAAPAETTPAADWVRRIGAAMAALLGRAQVGPEQDFFELGGQSLLAAQLAMGLSDELGIRVALRQVFEAPTPAALAACLQLQQADATELPLRGAGLTRAALTAIQRRIWTLQSLDTQSPVFNFAAVQQLDGALDVAALERAWLSLWRRQGALRTRFIVDAEAGLTQWLAPSSIEPPPLSLLPIEDLSELAVEPRAAELERRIDALLATPIDLQSWPLPRLRLFRLERERHVLVLVLHHILGDGASVDVFAQEMAALYAAECRHEPATLPSLALSYADYAQWETTWRNTPHYARQLAFWRERLRALPAPRPLPADYAPANAAAVASPCGEWLQVPPPLLAELERLARRSRSTVFMLCLSVFALWVARRSGEAWVRLATPVRGRAQSGLERLIGLFTNLLPLPLQVDPEQRFHALLEATRHSVVECLGHPDVQLDDLLGEQPATGARRLPYQALFSFQDWRARPQRWGGLTRRDLLRMEQGSSEDFGLWLVRHADGLDGGVLYNPARHSAAIARLCADQYLALLEAVVRMPEAVVGELWRPAPFERELLQRWSRAEGVRVIDADGDDCAIGRAGRVCPLDGSVRDGAALALGAEARWNAEGRLQPVTAETVAPPARPNIAPQTALQALLHELWRDALGHAEFGIDDDFFDLGGYSLLAARMFQQVEQRTGVDLPLATLYRAPTIARLASAIDAAKAQPDSAAAAPEAVREAAAAAVPATVWRPLVPIRGGVGRPLFLIHSVGGNVVNYRALVAALPPGMPVFGLQAVGLDGVAAPLRTVEAMAERYLGEILQQQPVGPYRLGGGSMGGVIAFEIARRLRQRGAQVELLVMFDTLLPELAVSALLQRMGTALRRAPNALPQRLLASLRGRCQRIGDRLQVAWLRLRRQPLPHDLRFRHVERVHMRAYLDYRSGNYDGAIVLFVAEHGWRDSQTDPCLGWQRIVGDRVRVIPVAGSHENLIGQSSLAQALSALLEEFTRAEVSA